MELGIPYMGSKRKLAEDIIHFIRGQNQSAKYFYDIFWWGGAISFEAINQGFEKVFYVDLDKGMCNLINQIKQWIPEDWNKRITREEFEILKEKNDAYSVAMSLCYSFGNSRKNYAYWVDVEPRKKALHYAVVDEDYTLLRERWIDRKLEGKTIEERRLNIRKQNIEGNPLLQRYSEDGLFNLQHLQSLENIKQLQKIKRLEALEVINSNYKNLSIYTPVEETIIYCDPPYRGTGTYKIQQSAFDYKALDKRFRELPYQAYMSEENPHKVALTMTKKRLLAWQGTGAGVFEVLYTNKDGIQKRQVTQSNLFE